MGTSMTRTTATKRKPQGRPEARILNNIRLAIGARSDVMILRISTGVYKAGPHTIKTAPNGTADIIGIQRRTVLRKQTINPDGYNPHTREFDHTYGQAIAIEVKSDDGKQSKDQIAFEHSWTAHGGIYILARSVQDVLDILGPEPE